MSAGADVPLPRGESRPLPGPGANVTLSASGHGDMRHATLARLVEGLICVGAFYGYGADFAETYPMTRDGFRP